VIDRRARNKRWWVIGNGSGGKEVGNSGFKSDQKRDAAYGHGLRELEMRSDQGRERLRHEDECVEQVGWMVKSSPKATSAMDI